MGHLVANPSCHYEVLCLVLSLCLQPAPLGFCSQCWCCPSCCCEDCCCPHCLQHPQCLRLCPSSTPTPSHLLVFLPPLSCSPRPLWPPLPSSMWLPPTLPSPPSSAASQSLPLPLLLPPLLRSPLESRWSKRKTRPVEVQKQRDAS